MKIREIITEVIDISGSAPVASWEHDVDSQGNKISIGSWKDPTGSKVENWFTKDPSGKVNVAFTRSDPTGEPYYSVTKTGQGKQASIMTGVTQHFRDYMANNPDVTHFNFSSNEPSRTKLYNKMVDRIAPQMGLVGTAKYNPDFDRTEYELRKAQPGETHTKIVTPKSTQPSAVSGVSLQRPIGYKQSGFKGGGGSGGVGVPDVRDLQLGSDLDPKAMMQKYKTQLNY